MAVGVHTHMHACMKVISRNHGCAEAGAPRLNRERLTNKIKYTLLQLLHLNKKIHQKSKYSENNIISLLCVYHNGNQANDSQANDRLSQRQPS